jgi:hypothetical protein
VVSGRDTLFWFEPWLGEQPLCVRFMHLFSLFVDKNISMKVIAMASVRDGKGKS